MTSKKPYSKIFFWVSSSFVLLTIACVLFFRFSSVTEDWRYILADSFIASQHREYAYWLLGKEGLEERIKQYQLEFNEMGEEEDLHTINLDVIQTSKDVQLEIIKKSNFTCYLLTVPDPKKVRLIVPGKVGRGEQVSSMVKRTGAIAGVNAGGFAAPEQKGNGFVPIGLVISGGELYFNNGGSENPQNIVGIDQDGKMIAGRYSPAQLKEMHVQEAVSFSPRFIVNGKGLIKSQADGWGISPRTAMAQLADGTILFAVVDGRQAHSIGATLYDLQEIFLEKGAVIAANLDGGASSVLVHDDKVINSPSAKVERYIPTAFLVFEHPELVSNPNIWKGLDLKKLDPSTW